MEETRFKEWLTCSTYLASEYVLFPLTTSLTRVQALYVNRGVTHQKLSSFNGIGQIPFLLPGFMCRLRLSATLDPYLKSQYSLSQVTTFAIVSSLSDLINVILKAPSENYKQQMQVGSYTSARLFLKDYFSSGGIPIFYRGAGLFFLRDCFFNVIRFSLLEFLRDSYKRNTKRRRSYEEDFNRLSPLGQKKLMMENFQVYTWCNVFSTVPAAIITTPLDVLKTRLMTQPSHSQMGLKEVFIGIVQQEGWTTLFRGAGLRSFYVCSMISISTSLTFYLNLNLDDAKRVQGLIKSDSGIYD
jgi:phosphatidylinositol phospholipase C delta